MYQRITKHIVFWFLFALIYTIAKLFFASPSDLAYAIVPRSIRFFLRELAFLPWKIIPFYFLFYFLIPKYFKKEAYLQITIYFIVSIIICLFGYRSMIAPVSSAMYGEIPDFNVYSFQRFFYSLTDIIPAIGLASTVKLLVGRVDLLKREHLLLKEKKDVELKFLKAQTKPHFLFNSLNNLYGLARKNDPNTAPSIMKLSNIMRYVVVEGSKEQNALENELQVIDDFIELEKLRYNDRLSLSFIKEVDDGSKGIAPLILLPFVENAFKHGTSETRFETKIDLKLVLQGKILDFTITNTCDEDHESKNIGIGLQNIKRQLELLYSNKYTLNISHDALTFSVHLKLELNE